MSGNKTLADGSDAKGVDWAALLLKSAVLPLRIFLIGLAVLLLAAVWSKWLGFGGLSIASIEAMRPTGDRSAAFMVAILVAGTGLLVLSLLWWLIDRYFNLVKSGIVPADAASMRDLPLGLPEGTVRAILALIVAVVGLPILILSGSLIKDPAVAGYINGIIAGVFGFYFGSRTQTASTQAINQVAAANRAIGQATSQADARVASIAAERDALIKGGQITAKVQPLLDQLTRQLELNAVLVEPLGKLLPAGMLPAGLGAAVAAGQAAFTALDSAVSDETVAQAEAASAGLVAGSAIDALIKAAAPMAGSPAKVAALLVLGWGCGSAAFQRWRAVVLAAPVTATLIDAGSLKAADISNAATLAAPLTDAWTAALARPGFAGTLAGMILADDAADRLWAAYSKPLSNDDGIFADRDEITAGLNALKREMLAERFAQDLTADMAGTAVAALAQAADPALQQTPLAAGDMAAAARATGQASATATTGDTVRAAFDALVFLVNVARDTKIDLPAALAEVTP